MIIIYSRIKLCCCVVLTVMIKLSFMRAASLTAHLELIGQVSNRLGIYRLGLGSAA